MTHDIGSGSTQVRDRPPEPQQGAPARPPLRADIQGLRAVAVGLVVLFHLWPNRLPGGYIGVDVFFVISGFLITGHLLRDVERTGRVRLVRFWMRRLRRLMPSALLVLLVSAIGVILVAPQQYWNQFLREVAASALYVQNWVLAGDSVDYLAADNNPSPVQHFWSLSVEEQFYVALPLLLLVVTLLVRGRWRRTAILGALGVVTAGSLAWSVYLTAVSQPTAYFVTTTRLWELGIGAFVSVAPALTRRAPRILLSCTGFVAIAISAFTITGETPFPGWIALFPVLGTAAVIWAGSTGTRFEPASLVDTPVIRWIGDYSYAIYLWHWPLIVLLPYALSTDLALVHKLGIIFATAALAWLSGRFVEDPIRFASSPLLTSAKFVMPATAAGMAVVVAVAGVGLVQYDRQADRAAALIAQIAEESPSCFGATAVQPDGSPCNNPELDGTLAPPANLAATDDGNQIDCWSGSGTAALKVCHFGPTDRGPRIIAVGDSHNNALVPAYRAMAEDQGWSVDVAGKNGCYLTEAVQPKSTPEDVQDCETWKKTLNTWLEKKDYDLVIVTHAAGRGDPEARTVEERRDLLVTGMREAWQPILDRGTKVLAVRDNPRPLEDTVDCVARRGSEAERCTIPRSYALGALDGQQDAVEGLDGASYLDMSEVYCDDSRCRTVIGHAVVYRDNTGHLTGTFARTLAPRLADAVRDALD